VSRPVPWQLYVVKPSWTKLALI